MSTLIQYIATYAPWIYFVCGVVALYQLYRTWLVRAERRQAVFSLEREKAIRELGSIFSTALFLLLAMGITYFTSTTLVNLLTPLVEQTYSPTSQIDSDIIPTPINTPATVIAAAPIVTNLPGSTVTPLLQPTAISEAKVTITVTPPSPAPPTVAPAPVSVAQTPTCPDQRSIILSPGNNETVSGNISMVGTATHENFQFYKVEYAPAGSNNFSYLAGDPNPVVNGFLAGINTGVLGNGAWTLRLVVVDQTGNFPEPCQVTILIEN